jgi:predicted acetyltransferase
MPIVLTPMAEGRDREFAEMLDEFRAAGEHHVYRGLHEVAWQGYPAFYRLLSQMKAGGYPTPDIVPTDAYFIEEGGRILGEVYVRHRLTASLERVGGNIGYKVRPSERNRGVATAALRLALERVRELGFDRALVTCDNRNAASARVIEKCGGVRIEDAQRPDGIERRYWVPVE